jgi:hypothetical protein
MHSLLEHLLYSSSSIGITHKNRLPWARIVSSKSSLIAREISRTCSRHGLTFDTIVEDVDFFFDKKRSSEIKNLYG